MPTPSRKINMDVLLKAHFIEDRANFTKMNKRADRMEKIFIEIKNDLGSLAVHQKQHAEESIIFREKVTETLEEIKRHTAPVIKDFEDKIIVNSLLGKKKEKIKEWANIITAVGIIGGAIIFVLNKFL